MGISNAPRFIPLTEQRRALLERYAAETEQEYFQNGSTDNRCRALWRHGLLVIVEEHPVKGWLRYDITELGRKVAALRPGDPWISTEKGVFRG